MREVETSDANWEPYGDFFGKLAHGDLGLARTYWLCGVIPGIVSNVAMRAITGTPTVARATLAGMLVVASTIYAVPLFLGTWRAANKYQGNPTWALLAKVATGIGALSLVVGLAILTLVLLGYRALG